MIRKPTFLFVLLGVMSRDGVNGLSPSELLGLADQHVKVNKTVLGYGTGAALAGTFLALAAIKNLPEQFSFLTRAQERIDPGSRAECNCREWCSAQSYGYHGRSKRFATFGPWWTENGILCNFQFFTRALQQCKKCGLRSNFLSFLTVQRTFYFLIPALESLSISSFR